MLVGWKMMRSDKFLEGAYVDMENEQGVWDAVLVTALSRTTSYSWYLLQSQPLSILYLHY
jgi:hypothetical protein